MDDKVKELVEWVAKCLYECKDKEVRKEDWECMPPAIKAFYIGQYQWLIDQILSHPDLYGKLGNKYVSLKEAINENV